MGNGHSWRRSEIHPADVAEEAATLAAQQAQLVGTNTADAARRTQGDAAGPRRRGASRGREQGVESRSSSPVPPPPPPLPAPRRLRNRSRSPLSSQGEPQAPDSRLMAAYYSEAIACSTCQKASMTSAVPPTSMTSGAASSPDGSAAGAALNPLPSDSDYSSAGSAANTPPSKSVEVQSLLKSLESTESAPDSGEPSPPLHKKHPVRGETSPSDAAAGSDSPDGAIDAMEVPLSDSTSESPSPPQPPAPAPASLASSEASSVGQARVTSIATTETSSMRHAQVTSIAPSETDPAPLVTSPPQQDGTPLTSLSDQSPTRPLSESGDARQDDGKDSEEDIDVGIMIAPSAFDGFFFGVRDNDKDKTDYFEQVRLRTLQSFDAAHAPVAESSQDGERQASEDPENKADPEGAFDGKEVAEEGGHDGEGSVTAESPQKCDPDPPSPPVPDRDVAPPEPAESNNEFDVSSGRTELSDEYSVDVEVASRRTEDSDAPRPRDGPAPARQVSENEAGCSGAVELMEIARASTALTAASSSVPDSESVPLLDPETVGAEDEESDAAEGAGDDSLVGCDMDLKPVAGGLFDPAPRPTQAAPPVLTKGSSLPAAAAPATPTADEQEPGPGPGPGRAARADRKLAGFGAFPFKAKRRQDKAQRSATASALIPCPAAAPGAAAPAGTSARRLSIDLKVADVNQVDPAAGAATRTATSTHRILSDVLQGLRQVILPRKSSQRGVAKRPRSGHRLLSRKRAPPAEEQPEPAATRGGELPTDEDAAEEDGHRESGSVPRVPEDDEVGSTGASTPGSAPSADKDGTGGVKKNHVDPSPGADVQIKSKYPVSTRSNASRSNYEDNSDTHSRSSRSSIAPPRTNFLTDNVLKSLARSSSIKYIDSTLRSTQRISGKTPERYRNVPLLIPRPEPSKVNTPTASKCSSPRSRGSRKGIKLRKRIKISETAICNNNSSALNCLTDHKENNKYYVYTVNDDKATELRLSEMFVLQEEPTLPAEEVSQPRDATALAKNTGKSKKMAVKKEGKSAKTSASKSKHGTTSTLSSSPMGKIVRKKSPTHPTSLLRSRRSGERLRGGQRGARPFKASLDKKASSALSLKKRQTEALKRLRRFSPSDGVVSVAASKCPSVLSHTASPLPEVSVPRVPTGDTSSVVSAAVASRGQSLPHSAADSLVQSRESCSSRRTSAAGTARRGTSRPRYRPTLRTPRISCVGMGAGNEPGQVQRGATKAGAQPRARVPFKHPAHAAKVPQAALAAQGRPAGGAFSGLHEMTEMLFEYSTLAAARGRSFAHVQSELVSLFEAPTKGSLPSNESHGVIPESANPSADRVLEAGAALRRPEVESGSSCATQPSSQRLAEHAEEDALSSAASSKKRLERSGATICSVDTEAKVAAALQEIMNSLTELRATDTDGALGSAGGALGSAGCKLGCADGVQGSAAGVLGSADGKLGSADGVQGSAAGGLVSAAGVLSSADGVLGSADGVLGSAAGKLGSAAGVLGSADGVQGSAAGVLVSEDGVLVSADGVLGSADGVLGSADGKLGSADGKLGSADGQLGSARGGPLAEVPPLQADKTGDTTLRDSLATRRVSRDVARNDHLHGLRYRPSKGLSTFEILDTILIEESNSRLASKPPDSGRRPNLSVKIDTWTSDITQVASNSVQATVSMESAVCQRTRINSQEDASKEALSKNNVLETEKTDHKLELNRELFQKTKNRTDDDKQISKNLHDAIFCAEESPLTEINFQKEFSIENIDMSPEFIPRFHNGPVGKENPIRSRHSPVLLPSSSFTQAKSQHGSSKSEMSQSAQAKDALASAPQAKLTGPQRAQKRIAGLMEDDVPGTIMAVLTDMLPLLLRRTSAELKTPRQRQIQRILFEEYMNHPINAADNQHTRIDPKARLLVGSMANQVALLVEDTARSAEVDMPP
ncbi:hypothetical protein KUF71_023970 [Frankliniella fusca]|uniref:Uncharacterized protein n=1 Tax=Frankliniella fusca TaxID=407009 RepID=A0AAE1HZP9_9NEOP|nr:hypothetical protein KUF71_023970 [Frankliniella fusca]